MAKSFAKLALLSHRALIIEKKIVKTQQFINHFHLTRKTRENTTLRFLSTFI